MVRRRNRKKRNDHSGKIRLLAVLLLGVIFVGGLAAFEKKVLCPNIESIGKMKAEILVQRVINEALSEELKKQDPGGLFITKLDEEGNVKMVQADSTKINVLLTGLSINIQDRFLEMKKKKTRVPAGALLGSQILSQTGPAITLYIIPLSVSSMDFNTEFTAKGINQTKYKIYIKISCSIKVLAPLSDSNVKTSSKVLIAEAVIVGAVPNSYVKVPKEDILDVTDE
ncbi:MAG: sporulation protein YunB [Clostridiales bacterium]|nr:sporulation protein YunB [Clostridiales bacterium]